MIRRLRDARLLDPVFVEVSDTHGIETSLLTVADFRGRKIINYRYGRLVFATQGGARFGMGPDGKDEFERLASAFTEAFTKWPTGTYLLWYPVKTRRATDDLARSVAAAAARSRPAGKCLRLEFSVAPQETGAGLVSTGLLIVNPPWTLAGELKIILPELERPLGQGGAGRFRLETPKP